MNAPKQSPITTKDSNCLDFPNWVAEPWSTSELQNAFARVSRDTISIVYEKTIDMIGKKTRILANFTDCYQNTRRDFNQSSRLRMADQCGYCVESML